MDIYSNVDTNNRFFHSASSWEVRLLITALHEFILKFCLKGGVESMAITEVFGGQYSEFYDSVWSRYVAFYSEFRTGKTQLSLTLCG